MIGSPPIHAEKGGVYDGLEVAKFFRAVTSSAFSTTRKTTSSVVDTFCYSGHTTNNLIYAVSPMGVETTFLPVNTVTCVVAPVVASTSVVSMFLCVNRRERSQGRNVDVWWLSFDRGFISVLQFLS